MNQFRRWTSLSLAVLLLSACALAAAGTAFSFRSGITWDTAVAQMMAAEGLTEGDGTYNREEYNGYTFFYLKAKDVYYVYRGDRPVMAYALLPDGGYAAQQQTMTALYGAAAGISADTVGALLNKLIPGSYFADLTTWRLDDGSIAALYTIDGKSYQAYIHEQRILGAAE